MLANSLEVQRVFVSIDVCIEYLREETEEDKLLTFRNKVLP